MGPDLESEMYQLSHMLTEQQSLLALLSATSLLGDKVPPVQESDTGAKPQDEAHEEEQRHQRLTAILEKVEGCVVRVCETSCHIFPSSCLNAFDQISQSVYSPDMALSLQAQSWYYCFRAGLFN
ncbi:hypothetical protein PR048_027171 [Dryococelus australis]|uniref:Uncharacterized protein n=1 Tax=Dryococelus australis TaxID=614101 RepID=A0ABQ9GEP0_9NEOP|nr:hypothetical protein PR048_027171 [Dryococelus australis]